MKAPRIRAVEMVRKIRDRSQQRDSGWRGSYLARPVA